ncbi:MAG: hypothetical protein OXJ52_09885 [Oligoflexia bacterium]|nr:hypothetical protein [Oligoflexia bacterium]
MIISHSQDFLVNNRNYIVIVFENSCLNEDSRPRFREGLLSRE